MTSRKSYEIVKFNFFLLLVYVKGRYFCCTVARSYRGKNYFHLKKKTKTENFSANLHAIALQHSARVQPITKLCRSYRFCDWLK